MLQEDGLVELTPRSIRLTSRGRLLMRNVAMSFDAYLAGRVQVAPASRVI